MSYDPFDADDRYIVNNEAITDSIMEARFDLQVNRREHSLYCNLLYFIPFDSQAKLLQVNSDLPVKDNSGNVNDKLTYQDLHSFNKREFLSEQALSAGIHVLRSWKETSETIFIQNSWFLTMDFSESNQYNNKWDNAVIFSFGRNLFDKKKILLPFHSHAHYSLLMVNVDNKWLSSEGREQIRFTGYLQ